MLSFYRANPLALALRKVLNVGTTRNTPCTLTVEYSHTKQGAITRVISKEKEKTITRGTIINLPLEDTCASAMISSERILPNKTQLSPYNRLNWSFLILGSSQKKLAKLRAIPLRMIYSELASLVQISLF